MQAGTKSEQRQKTHWLSWTNSDLICQQAKKEKWAKAYPRYRPEAKNIWATGTGRLKIWNKESKWPPQKSK
jgi:hypothetical protein